MPCHGMGGSTTRPTGGARMKSMQPPADRIVLRQSWLNEMGMCPERARQSMLGISQDTQSTSTMLGTAVHYGIEQCLTEVMETGDPLTREQTVDMALGYWHDHRSEIVRWNHKEDEPPKIIEANATVWWDEVRPVVRPTAVEWTFELPLVVDHKPEIWLKGTVDCVQEFPQPIIDWKNPGRKPSNDWEKKRWSVQAAAYTWAVATQSDNGLTEPLGFQFVHLVKGKVHTTLVDSGPAEWASLVALARSAGTLIAADLPVWPLRMEGWHCSPKWCGAWGSCRGRFSGPDPWNQLEEG